MVFEGQLLIWNLRICIDVWTIIKLSLNIPFNAVDYICWKKGKNGITTLQGLTYWNFNHNHKIITITTCLKIRHSTTLKRQIRQKIKTILRYILNWNIDNQLLGGINLRSKTYGYSSATMLFNHTTFMPSSKNTTLVSAVSQGLGNKIVWTHELPTRHSPNPLSIGLTGT